MSEKPLFTVIIPSYNQADTIRESIDSVLSQNYENLELIITDDGSKDFDHRGIEEYITEHKKDNLKKTTVLAHRQNMGTVRNLNSAFEKASGSYILAFAGDDCLYDENVITNFMMAFNENSEINIITAQSYRYARDLKEFLQKWFSADRAYKINELSAYEQYISFSEINTFAMGATAFRRDVLKRYGFLDQRYRVVEDWPLFLKLTRNGEKFLFVDFVALKHRAGGVSARKAKNKPFALNSGEFALDLLAVFEHEIFPYMRKLSADEQNQRIVRYLEIVSANKDLLLQTPYENKTRVKLRFFLKYPLIALKLFVTRRVK